MLVKLFHQIRVNLSATIFRYIFVNHRVVLELEQESSEIAKDYKHEDAGRHHPSNLKKKRKSGQQGKGLGLGIDLTSIYLSPTDLLSISLMTVSDILNTIVFRFLLYIYNVNNSMLRCKIISSTPNCLPRPAVSFWHLLTHPFDPENFGLLVKDQMPLPVLLQKYLKAL